MAEFLPYLLLLFNFFSSSYLNHVGLDRLGLHDFRLAWHDILFIFSILLCRFFCFLFYFLFYYFRCCFYQIILSDGRQILWDFFKGLNVRCCWKAFMFCLFSHKKFYIKLYIVLANLQKKIRNSWEFNDC